MMMDAWSGILMLGGAAVLGIAVFVIAVVVWPTWLYHRREVLRMRGTAKDETATVAERVASLEKRCEKLEGQITEVHVLLADEQRQMDRKLSAMLPDPPAAENADGGKRRGGERERTH